MNAIEMLTQCRVRQDNVNDVNDGTSEAVACSAEGFAPDIEPFIGGVYPLPACSALAEEATRLGLQS